MIRRPPRTTLVPYTTLVRAALGPGWVSGIVQRLAVAVWDDPVVARAAEAYRERRERSEEHTSELQSRQYLACRLLPEHTSGANVDRPLTSGSPSHSLASSYS